MDIQIERLQKEARDDSRKKVLSHFSLPVTLFNLY